MKCALIIAIGLALVASAVGAEEPATGASKHGSAADVGRKLSDPTSNVWALFTEFDLQASDGDVNTGDSKISGATIFQPILPVPLYGEGKNAWKMIVRPTIPLPFGTPIPTGFDTFDHKSGIGDSFMPLVVTPPTGNWMLGLGPTFLFPTSTSDDLGDRQWAMGPTGILGYKTKKWTAVVFPQYWFGIGSRGDQGDVPDTSKMSMLYVFWYNLDNAWQIGFAPTVTYNDKATRGNKWNVPVGLMGAKTTIFGGRPVKFQFGLEYSAVSQDVFGKRVLIRLNIIPVIKGLIQKPVFGGGD